MISARLWIAAALAVTVVSCARGDKTQVTDSLFAGEWTLGPATLVGPYQFTTITHVSPIGEHAVVVNDSRAPGLLLFDSTGTLLRQISQRGNGPGEYVQANNVFVRDDTITLVDLRRRRLLMLSLDGKELGTQGIPMRPGSPDGSEPPTFIREGFLRGGQFALYQQVNSSTTNLGLIPAHGSAGFLAILDSTFAVRDTLMWFVRGPELLTLDTGVDLFFPGPNHFLDTPLHGFAPDGSGIAVVERAATLNHTRGTYRITRWKPDGSLHFKADVGYEPVKMSWQLGDTLVRKLAMDMGGDKLTPVAATKMIRDSFYMPKYLPPVTSIVFGSDGSTWLAREGPMPPPEIARRFDVLNASGWRVGKVQLARPGKLMAATARAVWVVETDSNDVETLLRYPIVR